MPEDQLLRLVYSNIMLERALLRTDRFSDVLRYAISANMALMTIKEDENINRELYRQYLEPYITGVELDTAREPVALPRVVNRDVFGPLIRDPVPFSLPHILINRIHNGLFRTELPTAFKTLFPEVAAVLLLMRPAPDPALLPLAPAPVQFIVSVLGILQPTHRTKKMVPSPLLSGPMEGFLLPLSDGRKTRDDRIDNRYSLISKMLDITEPCEIIEPEPQAADVRQCDLFEHAQAHLSKGVGQGAAMAKTDRHFAPSTLLDIERVVISGVFKRAGLGARRAAHVALDTAGITSSFLLQPYFHLAVARVTSIELRNLNVTAQWVVYHATRHAVIRSRTGSNQGRAGAGEALTYTPAVTAADLDGGAGVTPTLPKERPIPPEDDEDSKLMQAVRGGLLFGLGLNSAALRVVHWRNIVELLNLSITAGRAELPTGLLLALGCSYYGSEDVQAKKLLSLHIPSLCYPADLNPAINTTVQATAIVAVGMVFAGTRDRNISAALATEITLWPGWWCNGQFKVRADSVLMADATQQEFFTQQARCTSCGIALGLIGLESGGEGVFDVRGGDILAVLAACINGDVHPNATVPERAARKNGHFVEPGAGFYQVEQGHTVSYRVAPTAWEGAKISPASTAPGAITALTLIMMDRGNTTNTAQYVLKGLLGNPKTPEDVIDQLPFLTEFKTLGRGVIDPENLPKNWDEFVSYCISPNLYRFVKSEPDPIYPGFDYISLCLHTIHALAGLALAMGIEHAGTHKTDLVDSMLKPTMTAALAAGTSGNLILPGLVLSGVPVGAYACLVADVGLAIGAILSGTGDVGAVTLLLQAKTMVESGLTQMRIVPYNYGHHMRLNMALGFLGLAGGKATLRADDAHRKAALLVSIMPGEHITTDDMTTLLQPLRHLFHRCVETSYLSFTLDGEPHRVDARVVLTDGTVLEVKSPCAIPFHNRIASIEIEESQSEGHGAMTLDATHHPAWVSAVRSAKAIPVPAALAARHASPVLPAAVMRLLSAKLPAMTASGGDRDNPLFPRNIMAALAGIASLASGSVVGPVREYHLGPLRELVVELWGSGLPYSAALIAAMEG
ncbi:Anaphase-promoting complex subunit 1 [Carpediemonas membranifera]|uniref:Anaphase-promoting complex subunit 1 n=1 Tax=Carpediemonas membranifera TaxID=201153 RepID=A0A8J6BGE9_9EUKA|nr:Anaphase-promoting complex subunit 1 [Carpediemonas membranifera]|eukprot:KAG9396972.1 Anaphase-promoting complex subunit 1 [Carpediemonas membranifera]